MSNFAQLPPGMVFGGKYRIDRLVKAGGMGAVYAGVHTATMRKVAIKIMRPEIVADGTARERFTREAQISARIESQHCVDVLDAGIDPQTGVPFLVMEMLVGKELGELLQERGRFSPQEVVDWLGQAARALDRAHASGIVHRDLKPENLFLVMREGEAPTVKVLDFGIARILEGATNRATMAAGTPLYMAPEQTSRSPNVGPHTDVWALGLTAYTFLVGRPYWLGTSLAELYPEILAAPMEPPTQRAARFGVHLPPGFDNWFLYCVERDPARRASRPGEAIRALGDALGVRGMNVTPAGGPPPAATVLSPATPIVSGAYASAPGGYTPSPAAGTMPVPPQHGISGTAVMPMSGAPMTAMPPTPPMYGPPPGTGPGVSIPSNPVIPVAPAGPVGARRGGGNGALFAVLGVVGAGLVGVGIYLAVNSGSKPVTPAGPDNSSVDAGTTAQGDDDDDTQKKKKPKTPGADPKPIETAGDDTVATAAPTPSATPTPPPPPKPTFTAPPQPTFAVKQSPNCAPGTPNEMGRCNCPEGMQSKGPSGSARCVAIQDEE